MIHSQSLVIGLAIVASVGLSGTADGTVDTTIRAASAEIFERSQPKVVRYAERLLERFDTDKNGSLVADEWVKMRGRPAVLDRDGDGKATIEEIILHVSDYGRYRRLGERGVLGPSARAALEQSGAVRNGDSEYAGDGSGDLRRQGNGENRESQFPDAPFHVPNNRRPTNLPSWFTPRDRNGDGQLSLAEYAPAGSSEAVASFKQLDANRDGLITPAECSGPANQPAQEQKPSGGESG